MFDAFGGFYFTDTGHPEGRLADLGGLFYAKADGSYIVELVHDAAPHAPLTQPNGCGLSPDGMRLYVAESGPGRLWAWDIEEPGQLKRKTDGLLSNGAEFIYGNSTYALFDSLAVDSAGRICIGTIPLGGISVIGADGSLEALAKLPLFDPFPTNICFGGKDLKKAYITAAGTGKIYELDWPVPGLQLANSHLALVNV